MNKIVSSLKAASRDLKAEYYSWRVSRMYLKKQYSSIPALLDTFPKYELVDINQSPLAIFLIQQNNVECLDTLLNKISYKPLVYSFETDHLKTLPMMLACMNNQEDIIKCFQDNGAMLGEANSQGQNLLHLSAINGSLNGIKVGLKNKVSANVVDNYDNLPLHYAARSGNLEVVNLLVSATTVKYTKNSFGQYPLHLAIHSQNPQIVKLFLRDLKVKRSSSDASAIHIAAGLVDVSIIETLLQQDPELIRSLDQNQMTPLHHAALSGSPQILKKLMKEGNANAMDIMKHTPLHVAVLENRAEHARMLMEKGADPRLKNEDGLDCLDLARHAKSSEIEKYLITFGPRGLGD